jgi:hypothetical protein
LGNCADPPPYLAASEQIRMRAGSDKVKVIAVNLVQQNPVRLNVAIPMMRPVSAQRVVLEARWQGVTVDEQQNHRAQLRHIFSTPLGQLHIPPEFGSKDRIAHL